RVPWTRSDGLLMMFHLGYRYIGYREYRRGPGDLVSASFSHDGRGKMSWRPPLPLAALTRAGCAFSVLRSANPPSVYRAAVQELLRCHYAVALEDQPVLHHEYHGAQRVDLFQRVSLDGDDVGGKAGLERTAFVV